MIIVKEHNSLAYSGTLLQQTSDKKVPKKPQAKIDHRSYK